MAVDYFLKLDGVRGGSTDAKHKDEIELLSFSFAASQSGGSGGRRWRRREGPDQPISPAPP